MAIFWAGPPNYTPPHHLCSMGDDPRAFGYTFDGVEGAYGHQHTPMLRRCIIAGTKERFEGHTPPQHPQNYIRLLGGPSPINLTRRNEAQCLMWGIRGAFPPSAAMVVTVFCRLPEHEPLFRLNPCLEQDDSCVVPRRRRRDKGKRR